MIAGQLKKDFPIFSQKIRGKDLIYLDSAASSQKPRVVIEAVKNCLENEYSNVHRGVHYLSQNLSLKYEKTRETVAEFIGAKNSQEIVFTKGATESLNLLANSLGEMLLKKGDKVLITAMEHHANIVPWQLICKKKEAQLLVLPMNDRGELILDDLEKYLSQVKIFSFTLLSNVLGTINEAKKLCELAKKFGVITIIDAAQAISHLPVNVLDLGCDFLVFSAHKIYSLTGLGVLWGKFPLLEKMPVYQGGGDMILSVSFEETIYAPAPLKFEAGTPPIVEVIALDTALKWFNNLGWEKILNHEQELMHYCEAELKKISGLKIYGEAENKSAVISFSLKGIHPHDVGTILDNFGIALRVGHHCAEPIMKFFNIPATVRASFGVYNDINDIDALINGIKKTKQIFQ